MSRMSRLHALALALLLAGCTSHEIVVERAPPSDRPDPQDPKPGPDYFWKPGHWRYDAGAPDYVWQPGSWEKERVNRVFLPGFWQHRDDGWVWHEEEWEESHH